MKLLNQSEGATVITLLSSLESPIANSHATFIKYCSIKATICLTMAALLIGDLIVVQETVKRLMGEMPRLFII